MRKSVLTFLLILIAAALQAQILDSLYSVWQDKTQVDSIRVKAFYAYIGNGFLVNNPDTSFVLADEMAEFGRRKHYPKAEALAYNLQGISFAIRGNYSKSLNYYQRSLKISEEIGDKVGVAHNLGNIAGIYYEQSDLTRSLDYQLQGLKILEKVGDRQAIAHLTTNIGNVYTVQKNYSKAIENYERSLLIAEEFRNKNAIAMLLGNLGEVHTKQGDLVQALDFNNRSLKINEEIGNKSGMATSLGNIGEVYRQQGDYTKALEFFQRRLSINEEVGNKREIAISLNHLGNIYTAQLRFNDAVVACQKALETSKEIDVLNVQKEACSCLYQANKGLGKDKEALVYFEQTQVLADSINSDETNIKLQQMEFDKQVLADSLANAEKVRIEKTKTTNTRNALLGVTVLLLLIAFGLFSRWRIVKRAREKSDNLLLNILPAEIAKELKEKGKADARDFDMVSILFTDFKEFTQLSEKLSAKELVEEINHCFKFFDGICGKYGVEKIKTIGDSYMAAGGLPVPSEDSTKHTILAALDMAEFIIKRKAEREVLGQAPFEMRTGVHTGNVVAGIVGVKKFQYDIWGDTVNTASRMESNGEVGKVNISQATYELLKDDPDFAFESRGKVEAKGKGEVEMFFVSIA